MTEHFESLYKLVFFSTLALLVLVERIRRLRHRPVLVERRWTANIALFFVGNVLSRFVLPVGILAFALEQPPGLLSRLELPYAAHLLLIFLLLDLWRYWEHRVFHKIPLLWRAHLVHHSDTDIDVTTTERHHPLEVLVSLSFMLGLVAALGIPADALGLYLLIGTAVALWSHANLHLPDVLERGLRWFIVTPGLHAVHHSALRAQTNSNYGTVLTLWDHLFGTYTDPAKAVIEHTGLEYFHQAEDSRLSRVLLQPFLYRRGLAYPERHGRASGPDAVSLAAAPVASLSPVWRNALLGAVSGWLLVCLVMWPAVLDLVALWNHDEAYRHAWLVMPMLLYLLGWHFRQEILACTPVPDFTGVLVALGGAACWGAATLMNIDVARQLGFVLALQGVAMSSLGWRLYWRLFPLLALMFLVIPAGDLLQPVLRWLTVKAIGLFVVVADLPHRIDGFSILVGKHQYYVVDACSGLPYVLMTLFLGYSFGLLLFRSIFKIAALALFGAFLGVLSNALRVNAIILIDWVQQSQMDLTAHGNIQWVALAVVLALLFLVLGKLDIEAAPIAAASTPAHPRARPHPFHPVVAGLTALLTAGLATWVPTDVPRRPHGPERPSLPQNIHGWELVSREAGWRIDQKGDTESLSLVYRRAGQELRVLVIDTLSPNAKLPETRLAPGDRDNWRDVRTEKMANCAEQPCVDALHTTWQRGRKQAQRHVYYTYNIGSFSTSSRLALRAAHGWHRLSGSPGNPRLFGFVLDGDDLAVDDIAAAFRMIHAAIDAGKG